MFAAMIHLKLRTMRIFLLLYLVDNEGNRYCQKVFTSRESFSFSLLFFCILLPNSKTIDIVECTYKCNIL